MAESIAPLDQQQRLRDALASNSLKLPLLPAAAADVLSASQAEDGDAALLAQQIQKDPALASNVLRIVNSPAFRGAAEIVALQQAIARLGMERIREIALSVAMRSALQSGGSYDHLVQQAWQDGLATALWSREIARCCRQNVENAYLCGLLHNIGIPVALHGLQAIADRLGTPPLKSESAQQLAEELMTPAGIALVKAWQLPPLVAAFMGHEGRYEDAGDQADLVAIVDFGIALAGAAHRGTLDVAALQQCAAAAHLNLYPDEVQELVALADSLKAQLTDLGA